MPNTAATAASSPTPTSPSAPFTPAPGTSPAEHTETNTGDTQSPVAAPPGPVASQAAASSHGDPDAVDVKSAKPSDASLDAKLVSSVMSDGSPKITETGIRAAVIAIKSGKQIAQLGGYTASSLAELKSVVAKLYKNGRLDADAAEAFEDGHDDPDSDDE